MFSQEDSEANVTYIRVHGKYRSQNSYALLSISIYSLESCDLRFKIIQCTLAWLQSCIRFCRRLEVGLLRSGA